MKIRGLKKTSTTPEWARPAMRQASEEGSLPYRAITNDTGFTNDDGTVFVAVFTEPGSRGKERTLVLYENS